MDADQVAKAAIQIEAERQAAARREVLLANAQDMKARGDAIAKAVDVISITGDYLASRKEWNIHMSTKKFSEAFAAEETLLTNDEHGDKYPFERSIIIGGVKFYCILGVEDLTKEESTKWITDALKAQRVSKESPKREEE